MCTHNVYIVAPDRPTAGRLEEFTDASHDTGYGRDRGRSDKGEHDEKGATERRDRGRSDKGEHDEKGAAARTEVARRLKRESEKDCEER